jgi:hypothetical protein
MDETPYQKKNRERGEIRNKLKEISAKINTGINTGCDFLPIFNGEWIDLTAWDGNQQINLSRNIRIAKAELLAKTVDEILEVHQKDFLWLSEQAKIS